MRSVVVALYNVTWGQCSPMIQNCLESLDDYIRIRKESNIANLLKEIRGLVTS